MQVEAIRRKYTLLRKIGEGLSGAVYLAEHKQLHHLCAVKCISKEICNSEAFNKEAELLSSLNNFYFPVLYDCEEDDQCWYLIEEYISGQSLRHLKDNKKEISQEEIIRLAVNICEAIDWLHKRKPYPVLYLDLKPEHIIIAREGIKLLDLGSAVYLRGEQISGNVTGTAGFASPEQLRGGNIDERSDIYSIGAVIYWMMTNKTLCYDEEATLKTGYGKKWEVILRKCLEAESKQRYVSVNELKQDIQSIRIGWNRRLEESLNIAVIGSQRRTGATHFAIGMSKAFQQNGKKCLYEEKSDAGIVQNLYEYGKGIHEQQGIYHFQGVNLVPKYGQGICEENYDYPICISDYGYIGKEMEKELNQADCIIAVINAKEWEMQKAKELVERYRKREYVYYVVNAGSPDYFRRIIKELKLKRAFFMPVFGNPFCLSRKERWFYKNLWKRIRNDRKRGAAYSAKE